jgi:hypothetical protein
VGKRSEQLQPEYGGADLQHGSVNQESRQTAFSAGNRNAVHQNLAAGARPDQEAGAVLPGKVEML